RERERVHVGEAMWRGGPPTVYLFGFAEVMAALRDDRLRREGWRLLAEAETTPQPAPDTFGSLTQNWMLFRDPPDHTRLRQLANTAFTPKRVAARRPAIAALAEQLRDKMIDSGAPADLIASFAFPLPVLVIADVLGVPEEDRDRFREWSSVFAAAIDVELTELATTAARADVASTEVSDYLRWIIARRREEPSEDLLSAMMVARSAGDRFTEEELIATCVLLLFAGHETTVNLIGNGTLALLRQTDQWRTLVARPELAVNATEELLRYDGPVQLTGRVAFEDMEIGGVPVSRGTEVAMMLGAANRDPAAFAEPERLDITRNVGRVMSFGMGIHFCLGAALARLEGEVAFAALARRLPHLRLAEPTPAWRDGVVLRGLRSLPVEW
ncbi:MAG: cytochrome P450, partial [Chloroflexota bacterium]|nr:cytochrome P450 [Chloroflexota bacterium]